MDTKLSERLASFIFKIEAIFSETNYPSIKLHRLLEAFNKNTNRHVNHQIYCMVYFNAAVGTAVAQCLRCCATSRKVALSIPDGVIEIFH